MQVPKTTSAESSIDSGQREETQMPISTAASEASLKNFQALVPVGPAGSLLRNLPR